MAYDLAPFIRDRCRPLNPLPLDVEPNLVRLPSIQAVVFDVYGTLLISGSGDVGTHAAKSRSTAVADAWKTIRPTVPIDADATLAAMIDEIHASHERSRAGGIEFPEVEIREIWQRALPTRDTAGPAARLSEAEIEVFATAYELATNPLWPMPGANDVVAKTIQESFVFGIVSNAQFFTPDALEALLPDVSEAADFRGPRCVYSYQFGRAKPGTFLYQAQSQRLGIKGIAPEHVLFVGNDLLNDVKPAAAVGFRTALFAGDARSYRPRLGDDRVAGVVPDIVLTDLVQLWECV